MLNSLQYQFSLYTKTGTVTGFDSGAATGGLGGGGLSPPPFSKKEKKGRKRGKDEKKEGKKKKRHTSLKRGTLQLYFLNKMALSEKKGIFHEKKAFQKLKGIFFFP